MADNPDELFDVVDPTDRVVGTARRAEVHAHGLLHRAVHILVQRSDGAIFLQKRSMGKDCHPGLWDSSASGHLDSGESYDTAAYRELREELGVEVTALRKLARLEACENTGQEFVQVYHTRHEGPFTLHPSEIADGGWFGPAQIARWLKERPGEFPPCFHLVWAAAAPPLQNPSGAGKPS